MRHRYASWASAATAVAAAALVACSSGDDDGNGNGTPLAGNPAAGSGAPPAAGMTAMNPITMNPGMMMPVAGNTSPGTAGSTTPPNNTGTAGNSMMPAGGGAAAGGMMGTAGNTMGTAGMGTAGMGTAGMGTAGSMPPAMGGGTCGPETSITAANLGNVMMPGPWATTMKASSGPGGRSTLFYPKDLGKDGVKHPVFHWGCGAGSQPSQYKDHLTLLASHGFVVIANASGSQPGKASLDWMLAENEKMGSEFFGKLDPMRVGTGGHSLGALETFQYASDPRLKLYVLVCGGSGSGTTGAANIHGPSIFLGGEGEGGTTNFRADYMAIKSDLSVFVTKTSTDHIACARNNLAPWVAFMRWQFCAEDKWKAEFDAAGTYCKSPWLACMTKNVK